MTAPQKVRRFVDALQGNYHLLDAVGAQVNHTSVKVFSLYPNALLAIERLARQKDCCRIHTPNAVTRVLHF